MKDLLQFAERARWLFVPSVLSEGRTLTIRFRALAEKDDERLPDWLVSCRRVKQFSLADFNGGGLNFWTRDHPLLSQFSSRKASLRVTVRANRLVECVGVLWRAHDRLAGDWIEFDRFVPRRTWADPAKRTISIAGPQFLLEGYRAALDAAQFPVKLRRHKRALFWSGWGWSETRHSVSLLHFGSSFVVAESFSARADVPSARPALTPP